MSSELDVLLAQYDYPLEKAWIAERPANPREAAKLLVYNRAEGTVKFDTFAHIGAYLPKGTLLVLNDTRVIPARVFGTVASGGKVEVLCTRFDRLTGTLEALANRRLEPGENIILPGGETITTVLKREKTYTFKTDADIDQLLATHGEIPIPPYLKHTPLTEQELRQEYQTVFAREPGSVAAPTASLHFSEHLLHSLAEAGVETAYVTLHVGLGTFAPLTERALATGMLHEELFSIPPETVEKVANARTEGRAVIPVGTTALRTLETASNKHGELTNRSGATTLFIQEGYTFKCATGLITNFHVPRSSLMMLVAALTGREKLLELYRTAHEQSFRFLSFGDGMLII